MQEPLRQRHMNTTNCKGGFQEHCNTLKEFSCWKNTPLKVAMRNTAQGMCGFRKDDFYWWFLQQEDLLNSSPIYIDTYLIFRKNIDLNTHVFWWFLWIITPQEAPFGFLERNEFEWLHHYASLLTLLISHILSFKVKETNDVGCAPPIMVA